MNNRNICNTCAPHTAGEACLAPTIAPEAPKGASRKLEVGKWKVRILPT